MNSTTKRMTVLAAVVALWVVLTASAASGSVEGEKKLTVAPTPSSIIVNGVSLAPPVGEEGFIFEGTTYVPLRFMSNAAEKTVFWDAATSTVHVSEPTKAEKTLIQRTNASYVVEGDNGSSAAQTKTKGITVYTRSISYVFDGKQVEPVAGKQGFIFNNKVYVPLRFFSEAVGRNVLWDPATHAIRIEAKATVVNAGGIAPGAGNPSPGGGAAGGVTPGAGGGIPGGGGAVTKPSYDSIIASAETQISSLQNSCQSSLSSLASQYFAASNEDARSALIDQGTAKLAECDSSFDSIMSSLESELTKHGYSTTAVGEYRSAYSAMKQAEMAKLLAHLLN